MEVEHRYDCFTCGGETAKAKTDCTECGGTGWHPPVGVEPDFTCDECGRSLWVGPRGPRWYQNTASGRVLCERCLKDKQMLGKIKHETGPRRRGEQVIKPPKRYL